jgi:hypothetical protein
LLPKICLCISVTSRPVSNSAGNFNGFKDAVTTQIKKYEIMANHYNCNCSTWGERAERYGAKMVMKGLSFDAV